MKKSDLFIIATAEYCRGSVREDFHYHNEYELIYVTCGSIKIRIGDKVYTARKNHLLLITNLEKHVILSATEDYRRYYMTLHPQALDAYMHHPDLLSMLKNHPPDFIHCIDMSAERDAVTALFEQCIACDPCLPFAAELAVGSITQLLIFVYRSQPELFRKTALPCRDIILDVQAYLDNHFHETLHISEISRRFCISSCYLSHKFKELTGFSPKQYLTSVRLKNAALMLCHTRDTVSKISLACGFGDVNNFIRTFKQHYHCLPGQYRAGYRQYENRI